MQFNYSSSAKYTLILIAIALIIGSCSDSSTGPKPPDKPGPKPDSPPLISPADQADNQATTLSLSWDSVATADSYDLQISTNSNFTGLTIDTTGIDHTSLLTSALDNNTTYYWHVRSKNNNGNSNWSPAWSFSVEQLVELSEQTKVMPSGTSTMIADTTANLSTITFHGTNSFLSSLKEDDILLAKASKQLPYGALRKITQVNRTGNEVTLKTEQVALVEAIKEADIHIEMPLTPDQVQKSKTYYKGVKLIKTKNKKTNLGTFQLSIDAILYDGDGDKEGTTNDQLKINGETSFSPTLNATLRIGFFKLKEFRFDIQGDFDSDINISSEVAGASLEKKYKLKTFYLGAIPVGPIEITPQIEIWVGLDGDISAGLSTGVNYESTFDAGLQYNDNWSPVSDFDQETTFKPIKAELAAGAKAYSEVDFLTLIYGSAGPYVNVQGYLRAKVEPLKNPWWSLYWGVQAGGGAKIKAFSREIADYNKPDILTYEDLIDQSDGEKQAPKLSVTSSSLSFPATASTKTLTISNTGTGDLNWKVSSEADWLTFEPSSGTNEADIKVTAKENTSDQQRKAEIKITSNGGDSDPIPVTQSKPQADPKLSVSATSLSFPATAASKTLTIENVGGGTLSWKVSTDASWLSVSTSSGSGKKQLTISAMKNSSDQERTAEISITSNGGNKTITVTQSGGGQEEPKLSYSPSSFDVSAQSGDYTLSIQNTGSGNLNWYIRYEGDWLSFEPQSGDSATDVKITVQENTTGQKRGTDILLSSSGGAARIPFKQNKKGQETNNNFYLANNGVTVKCPDAEIGASGTINGIIYTKRTKGQITTSNAATTCTSGITDMSYLFFQKESFNQNISSWDVSDVTNMFYMFRGASSFNQDIGNWDVNSVTNMNNLFWEAKSFNKDISEWDVSSVSNMRGMFGFAVSFNQDIGNWDVSSVTDMRDMFDDAKTFNQDISGWCVPKITSEPDDFATDSPLTDSYKPEWGTCPE